MPNEAQLGKGWYEALKPVFSTVWWRHLHMKVWHRVQYGIQPEPKNIFRAFRETPLEKVKVVMFAQDPYPAGGYADGLAFSSGNGQVPKSLEIIFRELEWEYGKRPTTYSLEGWAQQGVLLLNTHLTVDSGRPMSHGDFGWEKFITQVLKVLSDRAQTGGLDPIFVAFGRPAQTTLANAHINPSLGVITGVHPIAESYSGGSMKFVGGNYFKRINELLVAQGKEPIQWV